MASTTKEGTFTFKNKWVTTNYTLGWKITLTEGNIDYVNNQSRVYYYFGIKKNQDTGWSAANSNWFAAGFDTDATYDDEYNYRYNSNKVLNNTNWVDGYYFNSTYERKMIAWCDSTSYQPLKAVNKDASLEKYTTSYTTDGGSTAYRTFTHAADGSGSAKFGVIWARAADSNCNGLVGAFPKKTLESNTLTLTNTRAVVKIYNGSSWVNAIPFVYDGSAWKTAIPYVYNGSGWVQCKG